MWSCVSSSGRCAGLAVGLRCRTNDWYSERGGGLEPIDYALELNRQLTYLISSARAMSELDLAGALFGEFRGMQDAGWSTVQTAHEIFEEMRAIGSQKEALSTAQYRHMLCLYTQLAEAGGVYETLMNLMGVIQLKPYNLWPFQDLVRVRKAPGRVIGPNANAMFRRLASLALEIGMTRLSELLEMTFRDDIRNGIAHADYIIANDGLRLRRRNGGNAYCVAHNDVLNAMNIGLTFFDLLMQLSRRAIESFRPPRTIIGRFSANPPQPWTVELAEDGSFSISGNSPVPQADAAYERQERINNRLGGRVFMAFANDSDTWASLLAELKAAGFDIPVVDLNDEQLAELDAEIERDSLWKHAAAQKDGLRLATPYGFCRITSAGDFEDELPMVEELEVA